eukprot:gene11486-2090_t
MSLVADGPGGAKPGLFHVLYDSQENDAKAIAPWQAGVQKKLTGLGGWNFALPPSGEDDAAAREAIAVSETFTLPGSSHPAPAPSRVATPVQPQVKVPARVATLQPTLNPGDSAAHEAVGFTPQHELDALTEFGGKIKDVISRGASELSYLFGKNTSEVVTIHSQPLADCLWSRVAPHVPSEMKPAFDSKLTNSQGEGGFRSVGIIPVFRFMSDCVTGNAVTCVIIAATSPPAHQPLPATALFTPCVAQCDATPLPSWLSCFVPGKPGTFKSLITLAFYLNDQEDFEGGALNFVELRIVSVKDNPNTTIARRFESVRKVAPRTGRCVVFDHNELHEGGQLESGTKYMMQCDVLYEMVALPEELVKET